MSSLPLKHPRHKIHRRLNRVSNWLLPSSTASYVSSVILIATSAGVPILLTVLQFCDNLEDVWVPVQSLAKTAYEHRLVVSVSLAGLQICAMLSCWILRTFEVIDVEKTKDLLKLAVDTHFAERDHIQNEYRATVFKIRGCDWFGGEWIGIVCRTGETYLKSGTVFYLDRENPINCTGLVGVSFAAQGATIIKDKVLPVGDKTAYMAECRLAEEEYDRMNVKSAVIFATGIKRHGKLWGFLVLDSTDEKQVPKKSGARAADKHEVDIGNFAAMIGMLVK